MEILKIIETLQSYSEDAVAHKLDGSFANAVSEAVALLVEQGERIAELEETVINQRKRASDAEDFICMLCCECDWERDGDTIIMSKHCCEFGMPECGKFKLRGTDPGRWIPVTERMPAGECLAISMVRGHAYKEKLVGFICESESSETGYICVSDSEILENVTHWQQPEPPKEG